MTGMTNGGYLTLAVVQAKGLRAKLQMVGFHGFSLPISWWLWLVVGGWLLGNNQPTRLYLQIENMKLYMEMSIGEVFLDMPYKASRLTLYESIEI